MKFANLYLVAKELKIFTIFFVIMLVPSIIHSHDDQWHRKSQGCNSSVHFHYPESDNSGYFEQGCPGFIADNLLNVCSCNGELLKYIDYDPKTGTYDTIEDTPLYRMKIECSLPVTFYYAAHGLKDLLPFEGQIKCQDEVCGGLSNPFIGCHTYGSYKCVPLEGCFYECMYHGCMEEPTASPGVSCQSGYYESNGECLCDTSAQETCSSEMGMVWNPDTCSCTCDTPGVYDLWVNLDCENKVASVYASDSGDNNSLYDKQGRLYRLVNDQEIFVNNVSGSFSTAGLAPGFYYIIYDKVNVHCYYRFDWYVYLNIDTACSGGCIFKDPTDRDNAIE